MINTTNIIIPKRYRKYIDKVYREDLADSKSPDGATYWIDLKECCVVNGIHLAPFDFKEDLLNWLEKINVITSEEEYVFKFGNNINQYRDDFSRLNRINNKSLKKYLSNLNSDDIDLDNKLVNLYECGSLNIYYKKLQDEDKDNIENFIKSNAIYYIEHIHDLTEECHNYDCCEYDDWSAGLYNCDELYLNAIESVVRKLPKSEFESSYEVLEKIGEMIREYNNGSDEITADEVLDCIQTIVLKNCN